MWRQHGDAFQTPLTTPPQAQPAQTSIADLSPPSALPRQASAQEPAAAAGSTPWQPNPVAQTQAVTASQLPADLERPNLLSSSSHVQVCISTCFPGNCTPATGLPLLVWSICTYVWATADRLMMVSRNMPTSPCSEHDCLGGL